MDTFTNNNISTLFMYRPRLSSSHGFLLNVNDLGANGQSTAAEIAKEDMAAIGMFAGGMYFATEEEQNAYCGFMGLIPQPRAAELEEAFRAGKIKPKGYVENENRQLRYIKNRVGGSQFVRNPVDLAISIIEARNEIMNADSHVASILKKGVKKLIENEGMDITTDDDSMDSNALAVALCNDRETNDYAEIQFYPLPDINEYSRVSQMKRARLSSVFNSPNESMKRFKQEPMDSSYEYIMSE